MRRLGLLVVLALAACGGEDYPDQPQDVARAFAASNDGSKCRFLSDGLIEQLTEQRGEAGREACEGNVERFDAPKKVSVRGYDVESTRAEVELISDGAPSEIRLSLIKGRWRVVGLSE